ncbi:MAG: asparaginase domain-containing protein [Thermodesulfobacteriota bacterium]
MNKIEIITTGGTIDKEYFDAKSEFQVGEPQIAAVLRDANLSLEYGIKALMRRDSLEMTDEDRLVIRQAVENSDADRIVITHGTDTMVRTAQALEGVAEKTVVLTGAMQPARFRFTDAIYNVASALTAVQLLPEGVYVAMNGRVFQPDAVMKNVAENRFEPL